MKRKFGTISVFLIIIIAVLTLVYGQPGEPEMKEEQRLITIGFSQVGAESDWRTANSISVKNTFTLEKGYDLIFDDARQKQTNQIMAIRSFIQQDVDYIVFSPVVETGWDTVLDEARRADIPVIIIDRMVEVEEEDSYTAWVGSDFYLQGQKACEVLKQYAEQNEIQEVNIVNIQGTLGSTSQIGRTQALNDAVKKYGWNLLAQESGEYTEARAYEVMKNMLTEHKEINFVYCENDNEAFGAIEAISEAGKTVGPGGDIQILSFDATNGGLKYTLEGKFIVDVECNPLQGPEIEKIIQTLEKGEEPEKHHVISEQIFAYGRDVTSVQISEKQYELIEVTEEILRERQY